jgi:hypothetical protein
MRRCRFGLQDLRPAIVFATTVGRPDSVLLWSSDPATENSLRRAVSEVLNCPCVVVSVPTLERIADTALDAVRAAALPAKVPYRVTSEGVEWELCLVLSSDTLPPDAAGDRWLFRQTKNAVALAVLERRALLARKRRLTPKGKRVMLGTALNGPWKRRLESNAVTVACLTSRTLNRVLEVVTAANALRES